MCARVLHSNPRHLKIKALLLHVDALRNSGVLHGHLHWVAPRSNIYYYDTRLIQCHIDCSAPSAGRAKGRVEDGQLGAARCAVGTRCCGCGSACGGNGIPGRHSGTSGMVCCGARLTRDTLVHSSVPTRFSLAEILVLAAGAIPPPVPFHRRCHSAAGAILY